MALPQHAIEQEPAETTSSPQPEEARQETQEPETTAVAPTEPEVIEGEVIEIQPPESYEEQTPLKPKPYWLLIPATILLCLLFLAGSLLLPTLTSSATITLI